MLCHQSLIVKDSVVERYEFDGALCDRVGVLKQWNVSAHPLDVV
jgi:hypothetical protein